jgi:predicted transcriptional regulator
MKMHPTISDLIKVIDDFIERHDITPTNFGILSIGDPNLYRHLQNGRNPRFATLDRIHSFMQKHEDRAA